MNLSIEKKNVNNSDLIECRKYDEGVLKHGMQAKWGCTLKKESAQWTAD